MKLIKMQNKEDRKLDWIIFSWNKIKIINC